MNSFITGSHAYGTPRPNSDIDLVVLVSKQDSELLWNSKNEDSKSPRFGPKLNLLIFVVEDEGAVLRFEKWRDVTLELMARAPVTREEAVEAFKSSGAADGFKSDISGE